MNASVIGCEWLHFRNDMHPNCLVSFFSCLKSRKQLMKTKTESQKKRKKCVQCVLWIVWAEDEMDDIEQQCLAERISHWRVQNAANICILFFWHGKVAFISQAFCNLRDVAVFCFSCLSCSVLLSCELLAASSKHTG